jgi:predicted ester cyclase
MTVDPVRTTRPAEVVRRYLDEVLAGGDMAALEELVSNEEFRRRVVGFRRAFPHLRITTQLLISEGDLVAVHINGRGTHRYVFQGVPAA